MTEEIEKRIDSLEEKHLVHEEQLSKNKSRIKKMKITQKCEETSIKSRSIMITPFNGDRKNNAKYKSSIANFIAKCFKNLLGADPPNIENVISWKNRPIATVIFLNALRLKISWCRQSELQYIRWSKSLADVYGASTHESQEMGPGARRCYL
uniref:Uncharacterized protein n=1 Tax=Ditylenchus dipsaci TaxID=166011 RepID=A0A915DWM6_9BILA